MKSEFTYHLEQLNLDEIFDWDDNEPEMISILTEAKQAIIEGLNNLNNLDRSDPFWERSNDQATIYKLEEFIIQSLKNDPKRIPVLWTQVALDLYYCKNQFGSASLKMLYKLDAINYRYIFYSAKFVFLNSGIDTSCELKRIADELGLQEELKEWQEKASFP